MAPAKRAHIHATNHAYHFVALHHYPHLIGQSEGVFIKLENGIFFRDVTARVYWNKKLFQGEKSVERAGSSGDLG
jgi:hypothetical protein